MYRGDRGTMKWKSFKRLVTRSGLRLRHCRHVPRAPTYRGPPIDSLIDSEAFTRDQKAYERLLWLSK